MTRSMDPLRSTREVELGPRGVVEIALPANTIRLRGVDGDRVIVRVPADRGIDDELVIDESPGRVRIQEADQGYRLGPVRVRTRQPAPVEIDLPRTASVELQTLNGDVVAAGIGADSRWSTASGDLHLDLGDGAVTVESMSGDVTLVAARPTAVAMHAVSGDVRIRADRIDDLTVSTTSGAIGVEAGLGAQAGHRLSSVSGSVALSTPSPVRVETASITGDLRASGVVQQDGSHGTRTLVSGDGSVRVAIRTTAGDIRLRIGQATEAASADDEPAAPGTDAPSSTTVARGSDAPRDAAQLEILRALERGELDVDTASRELATIEAGSGIDG